MNFPKLQKISSVSKESAFSEAEVSGPKRIQLRPYKAAMTSRVPPWAAFPTSLSWPGGPAAILSSWPTHPSCPLFQICPKDPCDQHSQSFLASAMSSSGKLRNWFWRLDSTFLPLLVHHLLLPPPLPPPTTGRRIFLHCLKSLGESERQEGKIKSFGFLIVQDLSYQSELLGEPSTMRNTHPDSVTPAARAFWHVLSCAITPGQYCSPQSPSSVKRIKGDCFLSKWYREGHMRLLGPGQGNKSSPWLCSLYSLRWIVFLPILLFSVEFIIPAFLEMHHWIVSLINPCWLQMAHCSQFSSQFAARGFFPSLIPTSWGSGNKLGTF